MVVVPARSPSQRCLCFTYEKCQRITLRCLEKFQFRDYLKNFESSSNCQTHMNKVIYMLFLKDFAFSLFRKKRFEINFFVRQNASKFAIFIEKENPCTFFCFSFRAFLSFYITNANALV